MPIHYTIDAGTGIIHETWTGEVDASDLGDYWRNYLTDSQVLELRTTLVDMRDAHLRFSGTELRHLITTVVDPVLQGRDWLTAIVVADPVQYGVSRQYHVFADHYSKDAIFSDRDAALGWLLQKKESA
jgi:hypothetical protein